MLTWLSLAILAYFMGAAAFVIDKYLLALPIPKPFSYAFWVAMLSTPVLLLIPLFNIYLPGTFYFAVAFASGAAFFGGIILLYKSIQSSDVSVASTQVGATTAIASYALSLLILKDSLPLNSAVAFVLLVGGILLLGRAGKGIMLKAVAAGILIGFSLVLMKWSFIHSDFINGVFWTRIGFIGSAALALLSGKNRKEAFSSAKDTTGSSKLIFVVNKLVAASAFVLLYYTILLGNVTIINSLLGFQFLFIFLIALVMHKRLPGIKENLERKVITAKLLGIGMIIAGFLSLIT